MNDKQYTEGIDVNQSRVAKWFDNFWYHYKWTTIVVSFFLIVGIICTVQMCGKEKNDIIVVYAGRNQLSAVEVQDVCGVLEAVCNKDLADNEKKAVGLSAYYIMAEDEIKAAEAQSEYVARDLIVNDRQTYNSYLQTGESSVLLISPSLYESLLANERIATLSAALGEKPANAADDYSVKLVDTEIYQKYAVMQKLPEDTVICILRPYAVGKSSKDKYYEQEKKMLASVIKEGVSNSEN